MSVNDINDATLANQSSSVLIGNETIKYCEETGYNNETEKYIFTCNERNPVFFSFTLTFIYLPAINVVSAVFGPTLAGVCGVVWGAVGSGMGIFVLKLFSDHFDEWWMLLSFWSVATLLISGTKINSTSLKDVEKIVTTGT